MAQENTLKFSHRGVKIEAPHEFVTEAVMEHLRGTPRIHPLLSFCAIGESDIPKLGEAWPEHGGIRAAECRAEDGRIYDLVLVTGADGKPVFFKEEQWGSYGREIEGAKSLWDGEANTADMIKAGLELAKKVVAVGEGCYLPSVTEAQVLFGNLRHLFEKTYFWTSTQYRDYTARYQSFENGYSSWDSKVGRFHACVVRRVYR